MSRIVMHCPVIRCEWRYAYRNDLDGTSDPVAIEAVAHAHMETHTARDFLATIQAKDDLLWMAWEVIGNVGLHQGSWDQQHPEWTAYATRWRDRWHDQLKTLTHDTEGGPDVG